MIERPDHVRVVNGNDKRIVGRYNGIDYEFLPGKATDIPLEVARHVFGFGEEDKTRALTRLGWVQVSEQMDAGMERLRKIRFTDAPPLIEAGEDAPEDESVAGRLPANSHPVSPDAGGGRGVVGRAPATPPNPARK